MIQIQYLPVTMQILARIELLFVFLCAAAHGSCRFLNRFTSFDAQIDSDAAFSTKRHGQLLLNISAGKCAVCEKKTLRLQATAAGGKGRPFQASRPASKANAAKDRGQAARYWVLTRV